MNAKMKKRIGYGSIMIVVMVGLMLLDYWLTQDAYALGLKAWRADPAAAISVRAIPLTALLVVLAVMAYGEMRGFAAGVGVRTLDVAGMAATLAIATIPFWWQLVSAGAASSLSEPTGRHVLLILGGCVMLVFAEQMARKTTEDALRRIACTLLAVLYVGVGAAMILNLRIEFNLPVLVLFLAAVKFTDIGAYFTGSAIGRHKMIPWLSPGKSWEGLAGGVATAAIVSVLVVIVLDVSLTHERMSLPAAAVFGAVVGLVGQFADLCESLLKRAVGVKDSGRFLPEFGGILDILDSPLLAAPVATVLLWMMR